MIYDRSVATVEENGKRITVLGLALPLLLQNIFLTLYGTVSTVILSGYSAEAVSATTVVQQIINTVITVMAMISQGVVIITSISLGVKNHQRVAAVTGAGAMMTVGLSVLLAAVLNLFSDGFATMMNLSGDLHAMASGYLKYVALFLPLNALLNFTNNLLICYGHSKITMLSGVMSNVINVLLSYIVLYSGIALPIDRVNAVAICGGIAQFMGLVLSGGFFIGKKCFFSLRAGWQDMLDIIRFGVPAGMSILSYHISVTLTTSFITALGVTVINTKVYVDNIVNYTSKISYALGNANSILTGRHRGNDNFAAIKQLFRQNRRIAMVSNVALSALALLFHRPLLSIFTDDAAIIRMAVVIMALDIPVELFRGMNHIEEFALNANGDVRTTLCTSVFSGWVCNVLLAYILTVVCGFGLIGIWIAKMVDECFKSTVYLLRWRSERWMTIKI